ncbi:MAG: hypothetical protein DCF12_03630 [Snowella sp.]|jgi:hypothetical protein|nr:MAG: hypothetical protein DCF12_03630 [Snowella sp.]
MKPTHPILQKCLRQIEALPNLKAEITIAPYVSEKVLADGQLTLYTPQEKIEYICEIKSNINTQTIDQVIQYLTHFKQRLNDNQKPLLVTDNLSNKIVEDLLKKNIEFIDLSGNIYLNTSGLYLLVRRASSRLKDSLKEKDSVKITDKTLMFIFFLLQNPDRSMKFIDSEESLNKQFLNPTTLEIDKLCKLNYLEKRHGTYQIVDYLKLLERWELAYTETLRSQLFIDTFTPINNLTFPDISNLLIQRANNWEYLIGGELGAALATNYLYPITATLHVPENYTRIFVDLKLKPSSTGEITFLKKWTSLDVWKNSDNIKNSNLADPLLIHAELMMSKDERLRETADIIFNKHIKPRIYAYT